MLNSDKEFVNSIPKSYDDYLVPLIFEPYASDIISRLRPYSFSRILEIAAGTGVVTRALASELPEGVTIVATDLNQAMLDYAAARGTKRSVQWRQGDAMDLPFESETFDTVICQFGAMFFPDKSKAFREARRVLKPKGIFIFNVWDRIEENEFAHVVTTSLESIFPKDPPRFLARTPHGYHDRTIISGDLASAGFNRELQITTVTKQSYAQSASVPAIAYCQGTPLRNEIVARNPTSLNKATDIATKAIAERFGSGPIKGKIQAHVIVVKKI